MSRYIRLTPANSEQFIDWRNIIDVSFMAESGNPYFVLKHKGGVVGDGSYGCIYY